MTGLGVSKGMTGGIRHAVNEGSIDLKIYLGLLLRVLSPSGSSIPPVISPIKQAYQSFRDPKVLSQTRTMLFIRLRNWVSQSCSKLPLEAVGWASRFARTRKR